MSKRLPQLMVALVALFGLIAVVFAILPDRSDDSDDAGGNSSTSVVAPDTTSVDSSAADSASPVDPPDTPAAGPTAEPDTTTTEVQRTPEEAATAAARSFLDLYVGDDGRVRRDTEGDTVSEGQAYAMLLAVAIDDADTFERVWAWTKVNLVGASGTMAWKWQDGVITDANSATDADVDAARALMLAADRFEIPQYREDGLTLAAALLDENVVYTNVGPVLAAGPWATAAPFTANPSYISPVAFALLGDISDDTRWPSLAQFGATLLHELTAGGQMLPSDWIRVDSSGTPIPSAAPDGSAVAYGYDAFRTLPRLAEACDADSRTLAASMWTPVRRTLDEPAATSNLDGSVQTNGENPLFLLAAAASAQSAGDEERSADLLDQAGQINDESPSYYLGAWVALSRVMLDTTLLEGCATAPMSELTPSTVQR